MSGVSGRLAGCCAAWLALAACRSAPPADAPDEKAAAPSATSKGASQAPDPAATAAAAAAAKGPEPAEDDGEYQTIHARTDKGQEAEVSIKAPPGWKVMAAPTSPDPHGGKFTLAEATKGLPSRGTLVARIETDQGSFYCDLYDDEVPNTVANFVGLARGRRKYWDLQKLAWTAAPYFDGTTIHRAVPGFIIQGGDRTGTGMGLVGYFIPDESHPPRTHDQPGQLCMANRAKNANGAQFMITEVASPHLDGSYTIFGQCEPLTLVQRISHMPQATRTKPDVPVVVKKVEIRRVVGGAQAWRPKDELIAPPPGMVPPGRAVMVPSAP